MVQKQTLRHIFLSVPFESATGITETSVMRAHHAGPASVLAYGSSSECPAGHLGEKRLVINQPALFLLCLLGEEDRSCFSVPLAWVS